MTQSASSSSDASPPDLFEFGLSGRLPPLPEAFLEGRETDLLEPIALWSPDFEPPPPGTTPLVDRVEVARVLGEANAGYGHPRAQELADKLARPETRVVVTGQQPGLLGGPLMALTKTVAAVRHAADLEARGIPAVPVFWVATEDHDWAEIARASVLDGTDARSLELGEDREPLRPVGPRQLGDGMASVAEGLRELLRGGDREERLERVLAIYRPEASVGEAFIALMLEVLGGRAPLYLDALHPGIKRLQAPVLRQLIERRHELDAAYAAADEAVTERGLPLQVTPQPGVSPLFLLHDGERRRIEWRGERRFGLRGLDDFEEDVDELLRLVDEACERVSPGVLARPAVQDALLATSLQVLGPAELSYMTQAKATHALLDLRGVATTLRPQTVVLESRHAGWLEELGLPLVDLLERPVDELIAERLGEDVVTPVRRQIAAQLETLGAKVLEIDRSLEKPLRKTGDQIDRGLDMLSAKIAAAVARHHDVWQRRLEQMQSTLKPGGSPAERSLATGYLWARHGEDLVDAIFEQMRIDPRSMSVVRLG